MHIQLVGSGWMGRVVHLVSLKVNLEMQSIVVILKDCGAWSDSIFAHKDKHLRLEYFLG